MCQDIRHNMGEIKDQQQRYQAAKMSSFSSSL